VPADSGGRRDDQETIFPAGPKLFDRDPKQSIKRSQLRTVIPSFQDDELLAKGYLVKRKRLVFPY
jgi:hypothetical protein